MFRFTPPNKNKGFTLIELLVVISIIALLSSIVLASLNSTRVKAKEAAQKVAIDQTKKALQLYWTDNGSYPRNVQDLVLGNYIRVVDEDVIDYDPLNSSGDSCGEYDICESYSIAVLDEDEGGGEEEETDSCANGSATVGTVCLDGTVYVGLGLRTTSTDYYSIANAPYYALYNACNTYNTSRNETGWRVPTLDEVSNLFYPNKDSIGGFSVDTVPPNNGYYGSSTTLTGWNFSNNISLYIPNQQIPIWRVRCIRDVE
jgi:prepilin-type N-terminal cleavage/methylation domain-containing protein